MLEQYHYHPGMKHWMLSRPAETQKAQGRAAQVAYIFRDVLLPGSPVLCGVITNDDEYVKESYPPLCKGCRRRRRWRFARGNS